MAALGSATVVGNASVLLALTRIHRAPTHYPLASLATADFLIGMFVIPIAAARELFVFELNWAICSCWSTLDVLCCTASILSLCTLGWERWHGITAPLARARRLKQAKTYAALVWPVSAAVAFPTILVPSPKNYTTGEILKACSVNTNLGYVIFSTFFSFYLPAMVMVVFYTKILTSLSTPLQIRAHRGQTSNQTQVQHKSHSEVGKESSTPTKALRNNVKKIAEYLSPKRKNLQVPTVSNNKPTAATTTQGSVFSRQKRATRTIVMLMSLFLFCWTPFFIMLPIDSICECVWNVIWQYCTWLGYANSSLNPIVYAASSPSVRKALRELFTSDARRNMNLGTSRPT